jgi:hypothetical protein
MFGRGRHRYEDNIKMVLKGKTIEDLNGFIC